MIFMVLVLFSKNKNKLRTHETAFLKRKPYFLLFFRQYVKKYVKKKKNINMQEKKKNKTLYQLYHCNGECLKENS